MPNPLSDPDLPRLYRIRGQVWSVDRLLLLEYNIAEMEYQPRATQWVKKNGNAR